MKARKLACVRGVSNEHGARCRPRSVIGVRPQLLGDRRPERVTRGLPLECRRVILWLHIPGVEGGARTMVPDRIEREISIDAPVDRVWDVITQAEHIGRWFGDAGAQIDLRPGGRFTCTWAEHGTVHAIVERVD